MEHFKKLYEERKQAFEAFFYNTVLPEIHSTHHLTLAEAMLYSCKAGGKRFRPVLLLSAYLSIQENVSADALYLSSAVECIHTYSLIHDDLPSMDNDDLRRGLPTCHIKFSEATAILAGDALNAHAFYLLSKLEIRKPYFLSNLLELLHRGGGGPGMVSGQMEDIEHENNPSLFSEETLHRIHTKKTGALILSSLLLGNRLLENWKERETSIRNYGEKLGLLFQITDDILDLESTSEELGKTIGKDLASGKLTYPALFGLDKTREMRDTITEELVEMGKKLDRKGDFFANLPLYVARRRS